MPQALHVSTLRLYGYIIDADNLPVTGAYLDLRDENSSQLSTASSSSTGYYEFLVPWHSSYWLGVSVWADNNGYTLLRYTPRDIAISPGNASEVRTDIVVRPCGNLILNAYNAAGDLIRNTAFMTQANQHAYITDLGDLPDYGRYWAVHDEYSRDQGWSWDLAVPSFAVPIQTQARLHVLWEVPGFGQVILDADNQGQGYTVTQQGGYIVLNMNHEMAKSELTALQHDYDTFVTSGYSISPTILSEIQDSQDHLQLAEGYLAQTPPAMVQAVAELNQSIRIALWTHEELYLEKASADVSPSRQGSVQLHIINAQGQPFVGTHVDFRQTTHDFLFGANPMGKNSNYSPAYAALLKQAGLNYSYIITAWESMEPIPGQFVWDSIDDYQAIQAQLDGRFQLMGGLSFWLYRGSGLGYQFCPQYLDTMSFPELQANAYEHMRTLGAYYQGRIDLWEFNEQNMPWSNALNLTWDQKIELYRSAIAGLKQGNPNAKVLFDSTALPYEFSTSKLESTTSQAGGIAFPEFLGLVLARDIPVDVIGLEFYYAGVNTDGYAPPGLSLVSLSRVLDQYVVFGKPIFVRELSAPSVQHTGSTWWHRPWDEATQAEFLEKFYTIAFSKPMVQEIGWSYGVSDEDTYIQNSGLLDVNLNPKPAYTTLSNLLSSWKTSGEGETDTDGSVLLQGFAGDYRVTITTPGGQVLETQIQLFEQRQTEVTVTISSVYLPVLFKNTPAHVFGIKAK